MSYRTFIIALIGTVLLASCGYSVRQAPAVSKVRIGPIKNLTFEPGVSDTFILSLERELTKRGVRVDRGAHHALEGSITQVKIQGTAEDNDVTIQYDVSISGSFHLVGPEGKKTALVERNNFIVTFSGRGTLGALMSSKQGAITKALDDLAVAVASAVASLKGQGQ